MLSSSEEERDGTSPWQRRRAEEGLRSKTEHSKQTKTSYCGVSHLLSLLSKYRRVRFVQSKRICQADLQKQQAAIVSFLLTEKAPVGRSTDRARAACTRVS